MTMPRPTREELAAAAGRAIPDVIGPGLGVLFCGINPSLYSAAVGRHFARPGNRFYPALQAAGLTDRVLSPYEDVLLLSYGLGVTNLVARATATAAELSVEELLAGWAGVCALVERHAPARLAVLGVQSYRLATGRAAGVGRQEERVAGAELWVLPNPSGLNAHYQLPDLARLYAQLA
jgi:TDG/mug DNA glycosylase family protein